MGQETTNRVAPPDTVTLTIDGRATTAPKGTLLVEAAKSAGIDIPVFCYEPRLAPVGACRMCLVSIERMPKLQTACTTPVAEGMVVNTRSADARAAQSDVLGLLLANHPLDCPVCDKGGECPLQDTTFNYGPGTSTFYEPKRQFEKPIPLSPLIALDRERCIMCYRCVRFQREIAGDEALTVIDRGTSSEIAVSEGRQFDSPFSGNTIELCPVGALTSIPFRFRARPWDLTKVPSVCNQCGVGCNIQIEYRANSILRLTARPNPAVDDGWLCDRGRFTYSFVNSPDRIPGPLARRNGELVPVSWEEALDTIAASFRRIATESGPRALAGVISPQATNEELYLFGKLIREGLGSPNLDHWPRGPIIRDGSGLDAPRGSIADLDGARTIVVVGMNLIAALPVLHLRIRKAVGLGARLAILGGNFEEFSALPAVRHELTGGELALLLERVGQDLAGETRSSDGDALALADLLRGGGPVALLFDRGLIGDGSGGRLITALRRVGRLAGAMEPGGFFGAPVTASNGQGALDLRIFPESIPAWERGLEHNDTVGAGPAGATAVGLGWEELMPGADGIRALMLHGVDPLADPAGAAAFKRPEFLVVQALTLTETARHADVVLPAVSWAEKDGTLTNLDRRIQRIRPAIPPPGAAWPDWRVFLALGRRLTSAGFDFSSPVEVWQALAAATPGYQHVQYSELARTGKQWPMPPERVAGEVTT